MPLSLSCRVRAVPAAASPPTPPDGVVTAAPTQGGRFFGRQVATEAAAARRSAGPSCESCPASPLATSAASRSTRRRAHRDTSTSPPAVLPRVAALADPVQEPPAHADEEHARDAGYILLSAMLLGYS
ncbi:unnamed protein product [Urochloa humidicola]